MENPGHRQRGPINALKVGQDLLSILQYGPATCSGTVAKTERQQINPRQYLVPQVADWLI